MDRAEGALLVAELALSETRALAERVLHLGESLPAGRDGVDGRDGKDADPEAIKALVAEMVSAIPAPKDGPKGDPADMVTLPQDLALELADCVKFLHESPDIRQYEREVRWTAHGGAPGPARNVVFERDEQQRIIGARLTNGDAA